MKKKLLATVLLAVGSVFGAGVSVGIQIGPPPPPRVLSVRPIAPGPDYAWVDGYWYPVEGRYVWHDGYWTRSIYPGARWYGPRYEGGRYYGGYWDGNRGRREHDHHWDREHERDFDRDHHDHHR
jgi:hypothetical protein